jgi:hypothetical protein
MTGTDTAWLDRFGIPILDEDALADILETAWVAPFAEVWLRQGADGQSLCLMSAGEVACLLWQANPNDDGQRSHNPAGDANACIPFLTGEGESVEYPGHWVVGKEEAYRAFVHFFRAGSLSGELHWSSEP